MSTEKPKAPTKRVVDTVMFKARIGRPLSFDSHLENAHHGACEFDETPHPQHGPGVWITWKEGRAQNMPTFVPISNISRITYREEPAKP